MIFWIVIPRSSVVLMAQCDRNHESLKYTMLSTDLQSRDTRHRVFKLGIKYEVS